MEWPKKKDIQTITEDIICCPNKGICTADTTFYQNISLQLTFSKIFLHTTDHAQTYLIKNKIH